MTRWSSTPLGNQPFGFDWSSDPESSNHWPIQTVPTSYTVHVTNTENWFKLSGIQLVAGVRILGLDADPDIAPFVMPTSVQFTGVNDCCAVPRYILGAVRGTELPSEFHSIEVDPVTGDPVTPIESLDMTWIFREQEIEQQITVNGVTKTQVWDEFFLNNGDPIWLDFFLDDDAGGAFAPFGEPAPGVVYEDSGDPENPSGRMLTLPEGGLEIAGITFTLQGLTGDMDGDGDIDFDDIAPFVLGLNDVRAYIDTFALPPSAKGDTDGDGDFDFDDIPGFVALLGGGNLAAPVGVPEPPAIFLMACALAGIAAGGARRTGRAPHLPPASRRTQVPPQPTVPPTAM